MLGNQIKDPVGLEINNTTNDDPPYTKGVIYEREVLESWVQHQRDNTGGVLEWRIIEL
jgi:hypothetical protein